MYEPVPDNDEWVWGIKDENLNSGVAQLTVPLAKDADELGLDGYANLPMLELVLLIGDNLNDKVTEAVDRQAPQAMDESEVDERLLRIGMPSKPSLPTLRWLAVAKGQHRQRITKWLFFGDTLYRRGWIARTLSRGGTTLDSVATVATSPVENYLGMIPLSKFSQFKNVLKEVGVCQEQFSNGKLQSDIVEMCLAKGIDIEPMARAVMMTRASARVGEEERLVVPAVAATVAEVVKSESIGGGGSPGGGAPPPLAAPSVKTEDDSDVAYRLCADRKSSLTA